ncbi:MAG: type II toxin-antitoxin system RelE/ParE family toxin [Acidobacteriota bacterium]|nr:type II toxin-antitoxin system RelE/ParE family toxin [Acidobacteriota bacterium]
MRYSVSFAPAALRQFRKFPAAVQKRLSPHIDALAADPRPRGVVKLSGVSDIYRIRVGDYRIVYEIRDAVLVVLVLKIGDRRDVYR